MITRLFKISDFYKKKLSGGIPSSLRDMFREVITSSVLVISSVETCSFLTFLNCACPSIDLASLMAL